jgi:molecular chaperone IbpA
MNQIARFDTAALNRALIGFDSLFNDMEKRFANQINNNYPPHNIVKLSEDNYEIQLAVTGFEPSEITVEVDRNQLIIKGQHAVEVVDDTVEEVEYLHRGLASRDFTRVFPLAEHIEVGEGKIKNGVLKIALKRVIPEALKPRQIPLIAE